MAVDQVHTSDKPAEKQSAAPERSHFDTVALLKDFSKTVGGSDTQGATSTSQDGNQERKANKEPDKLTMTDAFAGLQGNGETRSAKPKGRDTPKLSNGKDGQDVVKPVQNDIQGKVADPTDGQPIKIIGKPNHFDPKKPTVAVLDDFIEPKEVAGGKTTENHGEISAKAAEANGFNVYRIQSNDAVPYGQQMEAIDAKIKSGELPLGKGDAVSVSLGMPNDLSIKDATPFFGVKATNDTLAQNKDKLLEGIKAKSNDPSDAVMQEATSDVIKSNNAIKDMQEQGIRVLHAAGNEGTDKFSAHFLNATELNSTKPNGQPDSFSADHNLTVKGDGVLPVTTRPADVFSKTSLYQDKGSYEINLQNGKLISGPITQGGEAWTGDKVPFDRNNFDIHTWSDKFKQIPNEQPTAMMNGERLGGKDMHFTPGKSPKLDFKIGQLKPSGADTGLTITYPVTTRNDNANLKFTDTPSTDNTRKVAGVLAGTSFSPIGNLDEHREEMERLKHEGK